MRFSGRGPQEPRQALRSVPRGLFSDHGFQLLDRHGDLAVAQHAVALVGDQQVVLDADAAEVAVALQPVVVDDSPVKPLGPGSLSIRAGMK